MQNIKALHNDADHARALARIEALMDAEFGTAEGGELDVLVDRVERYESKTLKLGYPSTIALLARRSADGASDGA